MGNCSNKIKDAKKWKSFLSTADAYDKFGKDGSLPKNCCDSMLELRIFLDDTDLTKSLRSFAEDKIAFNRMYRCWVDIMKFKSIDRECIEYHKSIAKRVYERYLKGQLLDMANDEYLELMKGIKRSLFPPNEVQVTQLPVNLFDTVLQQILLQLHEVVFLPYKDSDNYYEAVSVIKQSCVVSPADFDYMEKLGQGGFGLVVHVRKKSTGIHYAMKLQAKHGMCDCFRKAPYRVLDEKNSMILCGHPYVIELEYAFQTADKAMMVMELSTVGSLLDAVSQCPNSKMSLERVVFYSAEIILALSHMHRLGFIYRDLKPPNIILCNNGHIKLVDLGGIVDHKGKLLSKNHCAPQPSSFRLFASTRRVAACPPDSIMLENVSEVHRPMSIMGTSGYMAPEMNRDGDGHYTKAIDWWTLGVTMFELLYGRNPFTREVKGDKGFIVDDDVYNLDEIREIDEKESASFSLRMTTALKSDVNDGSFEVVNYVGELNSMTFMDSHDTHAGAPSMSEPVTSENIFELFPKGFGSVPSAPANSMNVSAPANSINISAPANSAMEPSAPSAPANSENIMSSLTPSAPANTDRSGVESPNPGSMVFPGKLPTNSFSKLFANFNTFDLNPMDYLIYFKQKDQTYVPQDVKNLLGKFLSVDTTKRLGSGAGGVNAIRSHPVFKNIVWDDLELKQVAPPFLPDVTPLPDAPVYKSFDDMTKLLCREKAWKLELAEDHEKYFLKWDFISSRALKAEVFGKDNKVK